MVYFSHKHISYNSGSPDAQTRRLEVITRYPFNEKLHEVFFFFLHPAPPTEVFQKVGAVQRT